MSGERIKGIKLSHTNLNYHIVFSTKGRKGFFDEQKMHRLCEYTAGIVLNLKCKLYIANGPADHIHISASIHPQVSVADFVRTIKSNTSRWMHESFKDMEGFAWQDGYSAFTVSYSGLDKVANYIKGQIEHHKTVSFEEELASFLKKHNIDFDPKYITG